jgi:hypothetical protein
MHYAQLHSKCTLQYFNKSTFNNFYSLDCVPNLAVWGIQEAQYFRYSEVYQTEYYTETINKFNLILFLTVKRSVLIKPVTNSSFTWSLDQRPVSLMVFKILFHPSKQIS